MSKEKNKKFIAEIQARIAKHGYADVTRTAGHLYFPDQARAAADGSSQEAEFHFRLTDETKDDFGTVFKSSGWNTAVWESNPLVTAQHPLLDTTDTKLFIGRGTYLTKTGNEIYIGINLQKSGNDVAEDVRQKLIEKIWQCCSVYARIHDYRYGDESLGEDPNTLYFINQTLLAVGIVGRGSNANSNLVAMRSEDPEDSKTEPPTPPPADPPKEDEEDDMEEQRMSQLADLKTFQSRVNILKSKLIA